MNQRRLRRRSTLRAVLVGWAAIVLAFFLWQTFDYRGIAARVAEWEFAVLGRYFPTLTLLLLVGLFALPALYLLRSSRQVGRLERHGTRLLRFLVALSLGAGVAALVSILLIFFLPGAGGVPVRVVVGTPEATQPATGPTTLVGLIRYDRVAAFDANLLLAHRDFRFAPVQLGAATAPSERIRYFVELDPRDRMLPATRERTGTLVRDALPGEVARLYRLAGYAIEQPHYVLFANRDAMRWPYYSTAAQFALAALLLAAGALLQHRRVKRLRELPDLEG